jgi:hypothetical protein
VRLLDQERRVVHQDVDPADLVDQPAADRRVREVRPHGAGQRAPVLIEDVHANDLASARGQRFGDGPADAPRAAGDESNSCLSHRTSLAERGPIDPIGQRLG